MLKNYINTLFAGVLLFSSAHQLYGQDCCSLWTGCSGSGYSYGVNAPVGFADLCSCNWQGTLEYLYWKPYEDGLKFATITTFDLSQQPGQVKFHNDAENKFAPYDWDSGFRVGLGYGFPCDKWALSLDWTHYLTDVNKSLLVSGGEITGPNETSRTLVLPPFLTNFFGITQVANSPSVDSLLDGQWKLQFNQIDLQLARAFYVGPCVTLRPHIGLSYLSIQQNLLINILYSIFTPSGDADVLFSGRYKCDFKGVGIRGGLGSNWEITCGLGIYGDWSLAAYYGTFNTSDNIQFDGASGNNSLHYSADIGQKFQALRVVNDLSIGLSWMSRFNCDKNMVLFKAGWEHHAYFGQNMFTNLFYSGSGQTTVVGDVNYLNQNLYLYGFVFSASVSF